MGRIIESFEEFSEKGKLSGFKLVIGEMRRNPMFYIVAKIMSDDYTYTYAILTRDTNMSINAHIHHKNNELYTWCVDSPSIIESFGLTYAPLPLELKNFLETQDWYDKDLTEEEMKNSLDVLRYTLG